MSRYVSSYFSPDRGASDVVIGFIDRCNVSIDVAVYSITHDEISDALIRAHERGVKVRVLTDKTQAGNYYADDEKMEAAGIPVIRDTVTGLMHHKFMLGDAETTERAMATGSFNWSANADLRNMENFVIIRLKYVIEEFQEEFDKLWEQNLANLTGE